MTDFGSMDHRRARLGYREIGGVVTLGLAAITWLMVDGFEWPGEIFGNIGSIATISALVAWLGTRGLCWPGFVVVMGGGLVTEALLNSMVFESSSWASTTTTIATLPAGAYAYWFGNGRNTRTLFDRTMLTKGKADEGI